MKRVIKNQKKMKDTMYIVFGVFALTLFGITMLNPSYAEEGLIIDDALDAVAQQITSGSGGFEKVEEEKMILPVEEDEGEDEDVVEPEATPVEEIEEGEGEDSQDLDDTNLEGGDGDNVNEEDFNDVEENQTTGDEDVVEPELAPDERTDGGEDENLQDLDDANLEGDDGDKGDEEGDLDEKNQYILENFLGLSKGNNGLEVMNTDEMVTVSFDTNGGPDKDDVEVEKGGTLKSALTKYSYTENLSGDGTRKYSYSSDRILGSDRNTPDSMAHVITITGAKALQISIDYGTTSDSLDWVCIWSGSHPDFTAYNNKSSAILKLGGCNYGGTSPYRRIITVSGDTATFAFRKYPYGVGGSYQGTPNYEVENYGYYAVVQGVFEDPTREGYTFVGWYTDRDGGELFDVENTSINEDITLYAHWEYLGDFAVLTTGQDFNVKIKNLANNSTSLSVYSSDNKIQKIERSETPAPSGVRTEIISSETSPFHIVAWYDNGTIKYHTLASTIYMNENSSSMFKNCKSLTNLDISSWNISNVTDMSNMFYNVGINGNLDLSSWNISNVTGMSNIFEYAEINGNLDLSSWDISAETSISSMFYDIYVAGDLDLSSWDVSNLTSLDSMFQGAKINGDLDLSNWNVSNVTNMHGMFSSAEITGNFMGLGSWNTSSVENMSNMFQGAKINGDFNLSYLDTSNVIDMSSMFYGATINGDLDLSNWTTDGVKDMSYMFQDATINGDLDLSSWDTSNVTDRSSMFASAEINGDLDLSSWDTSSVEDMSSMFYHAYIDGDLDLGSWDVSNLTTLYEMFQDAKINGDLDLSNWNVSNVTNMHGMFSSVRIYGDLDLSNWTTDGVKDMSYMFYEATINGDLHLSNLNTINVTDMSEMFYYAKINGDLDLSSWNVSNVTNMYEMFYEATINGDLDLSNWNMSSVENMGYMFEYAQINGDLNLVGWHNDNGYSIFFGEDWYTIENVFYDIRAEHIYVSENFEDGIYPEDEFYMGGDSEEVKIWESFGYGAGDGNEDINVTFSDGVYGSEGTYCNGYMDGSYFKLDGGYGDEGCFSLRCLGDSHKEGNVCIGNTKTEDCIPGVMENGSYTVEPVEVTWNVGANSWNTTPSCTKFTCDTNYHTEDNLTCILNTKEVVCTESGKPANSSYVPGNVQVTWNGTWDNGNWTTADNCAWSCNTNYHTEDNATCTLNTKEVACTQSGKPANSSYVPGNVQVTWNGTWNNGNWTTADNCAWSCDTNYHTEDNATCTLNTKEVACTQSGKPANSSYIPGNVQVTWNGTWNNGNWTTADNCAWSCDTNYHTEDNATCTLNTKEVACTQSGKPANSSYIPGNVQVTWNGTWNNGNWTTADNCAWSCDTNYHTEDNATCTLNTKEVACTQSGKPANSSYVPGNVQVTWNGTWNNGNWTTADNCAWSCNANYHKEGNVCTGNTKEVACTQSGKPANSSYIPGNVQVTWNGTWNNGNWTTADNCGWSCNANYHKEGNACTGNTKEVACTESGKPANSSYIPGNVEVTWNGTWDNGNWATAANCAWSCDTNYHTEDNATCTLNTKEVACTESGKPANSSYIPGNVEVTWNGTWDNGNWATAANCGWSCNANYHKEGNVCTGNTKEVACTESGKPVNSSYISGNVQVTWNGTWDNGNWATAANCAWSCDTNYHVGSGDDSCEYNIKQENCIPGTIANGNYTVEKVNIEWNPALNNNQGGWNAIPLCTNFTCNTNFHKEGNTCKADVISGGSSGGGGRSGGRKTEDKREINKEDEIKEEEHNAAEEQIDNTIKTEQIDTIKAEKTDTINMDQTVQQDNKNSDAVNTENKDTVKNVGLSYVPEYTEEQEEAYEFAKENGITTMSTISEAKMNIPLTRIQMAKMLSNFAINVMGKEPDYSKGTVKFRDVSNKMDREYDGAVTNSYVLGIMGQNMKNNEFRPNDEVSRAEFVTALSRMLYETDDGQYKSTRKYYQPHMAKLYNEGIISKTDPDMKEKRGYVMIMLMRSEINLVGD